jgi:S1-C subfamily serine protease
LDWIRSGSVPRAWLGAFAVPADAERRARYKLSPDVKLIVEQVFPGSPAAAAGLVRGDGLVKVLNEEAVSLPRLHERLLKTRPGESAEVAVSRAGQPLSFNLTLTPRPEKPRLSGIDSLRFFGELEIVRQDDDTLVVGSVIPGSEPSRAKIASGDVLLSVLSKKDWEHGAKDNSRWRSVHTVTELESRLDTAYSEFDFCLGLRFRAKDGTKRELLLWEILTPTAAL